MAKKYVKQIITKFFVVEFYEENWDDPWYGATQRRIFVDRETAEGCAEHLAEGVDGVSDVQLYTGVIDDDGEIVPGKLLKEYENKEVDEEED